MEIITLRLAGRLAAQSYRQDGCRCWVLTARWRGDRRAHVSYRVLADGTEGEVVTEERDGAARLQAIRADAFVTERVRHVGID